MNLSKLAEALRLAGKSLTVLAEALEDEPVESKVSLTDMRAYARNILKQRGSKLE